MRLLCAMLLLCNVLTAGDVPIVPLEIRQPDATGQLQSLGRGSAVVLDTGEADAPGLLLLTAAHVVVARMDCSHPEKNVYLYYPSNVVIEAELDGYWEPVRLRCCSLYGDAALLSVTTTAKYAGLRFSTSPAAIGDRASINGYTNGSNFNRSWGSMLAVNYYRNSQLLCLDRTVPVGGQSGGAVLDSSGNLLGIITGYPTQEPWHAILTGKEDLERLVKVGWDGKWDKPSQEPHADQSNRLHTRIPEGEYLIVDPKAPSVP